MNFGYKKTIKKRKELSSKSKKVKSKAFVSFFKIVLFVIVLAFVVAGFTGFGMVKGMIDSAPEVSELDISPSGFSTIVYDTDGVETTRISAAGSNRELATIEEIPENLKWAFIDIEDERFYEHNGIDLKGIFRAAFVAITNRDLSEGASTITQQLLKNNVFETGGRESNTGSLVKRKVQEQYLALELEKVMDKEIILENYLNTINLGGGNYGVKVASRYYFNKEVSELNISESSVIAAITQNPTRLNPVNNPEANAQRRSKILGNMKKNGHINQEEYDEAVNDDVYSRIQTVNSSAESSIYTYFVDALIEQVLEDLEEQKGYTSSQAIKALYSGGLSIYTTQDTAIQQITDEELANDANYAPNIDYSVSWAWSIQKADGTTKHFFQEDLLKHYRAGNSAFKLIFPNQESAQQHINDFKASQFEDGDTDLGENTIFTKQPQASFSVTDQKTGYVKALVGGRGNKEASRTLNRATETTRQPGSCFKPVAAFAPALDTAGYTLATPIDDAPFNYKNGKPVRNHWGGEYRGLSSVRAAIRDSMNVVSVKTITDITPQLAYDYLLDFGFTTLDPSQDMANQAVALGGLYRGVTNLELTAAYAAIANGGVYIEPTLYTKVLDHNGQVLLEHTPKTHRVIKDSTAYLLTSAMRDVITSGTGTTAAVPGMNVAGKTGTSNDTIDQWFSGYTPYLTASIWMGYDENKTMSSVSYHNRIWSKVMTRVNQVKGFTNKEFDMPSTIESASVCSKSGKLAIPGICDHDPAGSSVVQEYFARGTVPTKTCDAHVEITICSESNQTATDKCPEATRVKKVFRIRPEGSVGTTRDSAYTISQELLDSSCTLHQGGAGSQHPDGQEQEVETEQTQPQGKPQQEGQTQQ